MGSLKLLCFHCLVNSAGLLNKVCSCLTFPSLCVEQEVSHECGGEQAQGQEETDVDQEGRGLDFFQDGDFEKGFSTIKSLVFILACSLRSNGMTSGANSIPRILKLLLVLGSFSGEAEEEEDILSLVVVDFCFLGERRYYAYSNPHSHPCLNG